MTDYTLSAIIKLPVKDVGKGQGEGRGTGNAQGPLGDTQRPFQSRSMTESNLGALHHNTKGVSGMATQEVVEKREYQAVDVLRRADVGYCRAASILGQSGTSQAMTQTNGDTAANSIVLAAVQYAFENPDGFKAWLQAQFNRIVDETCASIREDQANGDLS